MSKIQGFSIDFPDLDGTVRQRWYAESLRQRYVFENEDRFREIEEHTLLEVDGRDLEYKKTGYFHTWEMEFNEEEMVCLYVENAGGVIAHFKEYFWELDSQDISHDSIKKK